MLEEIALSISTALFFLCTAVVGSVLPEDTACMSVPVSVSASVDSETADTTAVTPQKFDIVGTWKSGGHTLEFKPSGRLIFDGRSMSYSIDGSVITVTTEIGGIVRTRELAFVPLSENLMKINGIAAYKIG